MEAQRYETFGGGDNYQILPVDENGNVIDTTTPDPALQKTNVVDSHDPDKELAQITQEQWDDYQTNFLPEEKRLMGDITNPKAGLDAGLRAQQTAGDAYRGSVDDTYRGFSRSGTTMSGDAYAKMNSNMQRGLSTAMVDANNRTRRHTESRNLDATQNMLEAGHSLKGNAIDGLTTAAGLQSQRESANAAISASNKSRTLGSIGSLAGLGAAQGWGALAAAGPAGAAVGASIGLLASLF
jgi:hypothetical protein